MRAHRRAVVLAAAPLVAVGFGGASAEPTAPPLPKDYRSWTHVRSLVVTDPDHGMYGFQDVYANKLALETLRSKVPGATYKDGATIVVAIYEVVTEDGMVKAGAKRRASVKVKDHTATATGWRFAVYDRAGKPVKIDPASCLGCHAQAKDTDFVFARFAE